MALPASRQRQRGNVGGLLQRPKAFVPSRLDGKVETSGLVTWCEPWRQPPEQQPDVGMDTAPRHRAHAWIKHSTTWGKQGLLVTYLPADAPA